MRDLDGIKKYKEENSQTKFDLEDIGEAEESKAAETKPARLIDTFKLNKISHVKAQYARKASRVKIKRPRAGGAKTIVLIVLLFVAVASIAIFTSREYALLRFAGALKNESILIGLQNSAELRPTGGFWGSFLIWEIKNNFRDSQILFETNPYKKNNPLMEEAVVESPKPIKETWPDMPLSFVNANWSYDFPEAAKTISWYFGQGWDRPNNGVVAISSLAMIDLLRLTGPVEAGDGTQISADNFTQILSQKIDTEYWQNPQNIEVNEPKTILKDIAPQIISKAKKISKLKMYKYAKEQMKKGRVICYFPDPKKEKFCEKLGISGKVEPYSVDYLSVNNTNLNGGKSSLNISQSISYEVSRADNQNIGALEIKRTCEKDKWPNIVNRNYTRVITPLGSKILSATLADKDITNDIGANEEFGRTTFGFWFSVAPGETIEAKIKYLLPYNISSNDSYNLVVQKQPGTLPDNIEVKFFDRAIFKGENDISVLRTEI